MVVKGLKRIALAKNVIFKPKYVPETPAGELPGKHLSQEGIGQNHSANQHSTKVSRTSRMKNLYLICQENV